MGGTAEYKKKLEISLQAVSLRGNILSMCREHFSSRIRKIFWSWATIKDNFFVNSVVQTWNYLPNNIVALWIYLSQILISNLKDIADIASKEAQCHHADTQQYYWTKKKCVIKLI